MLASAANTVGIVNVKVVVGSCVEKKALQQEAELVVVCTRVFACTNLC